MSKRLDIRTVQDKTAQYYSHFCGVNLAVAQPGIHFVCLDARDEIVKGFGCKFSLYIFVRGDVCVVSYSPKYSNFVEKCLKNRSVDEIISAAEQKHELSRLRLMIFNGETVAQYGDARILTAADFPLYETFFREIYPQSNPDGWLYEYFVNRTSKERFFGYIKDGCLVSVCDAPDMPFMEEEIQHTGIATLPTERRKGYARCVVAFATHHLIEKGVCPQWECEVDNVASFELAKSIGYVEYGKAYIWEQ